MSNLPKAYTIYPRGKQRLVRRLLPTAREVLVRRALEGISLNEYRQILVAGSGADPYRALFTNAEEYYRFDIEGGYPEIDVQADAHLLPFTAESFDCILATELLEHLRNPWRFISEAHRVLEPGGVFLATVPFMFHEHAHPHDFLRPTKEMLNAWLEPYAVASIQSQGHRGHVISDLITTAFSGKGYVQAPFVALRLFNHLFPVLDRLWKVDGTTAPSGYLIVAEKES